MSAIRLIVGSGRSGTTWVQDSLAVANYLRPVFEPLHPAVSEIGARYAYRALAAGESHTDLRRFLTESIAGHRHAIWMRYRGRPDLLLPPVRTLVGPSSTRTLFYHWRYFLRGAPRLVAAARNSPPIVKCIRANLMLGWLGRWFDCRTVFVIRHPGAVIESQLRLSQRIWDPKPILRRYRADFVLHEMTQGRYSDLLNRSLSRTEALAVNWIIENQWALEKAGELGISVVQYERLRAFPDLEWPRICSALDVSNIPGREVRERPSQQSSPGSPVESITPSKNRRWQRSLTPEQTGQIQAILDEARFDLYSMSDPEPNGMKAEQASPGTAVLGS